MTIVSFRPGASSKEEPLANHCHGGVFLPFDVQVFLNVVSDVLGDQFSNFSHYDQRVVVRIQAKHRCFVVHDLLSQGSKVKHDQLLTIDVVDLFFDHGYSEAVACNALEFVDQRFSFENANRTTHREHHQVVFDSLHRVAPN